MSEFATFTFHWKDASPLDQTVKQISSFLFPGWRCIGRLKSENVLDSSLTMWRDGNRCTLVYLTNQIMKAAHVVTILDFLEKAAAEGASNNQWISKLSVCLFALKFDSDFLSKLRFFSSPIQTYEWGVSCDDGKETVLVHEIGLSGRKEEKKAWTENGEESSKTPSSQPLLQPLTSEELSAFVQLGMDLRKTRQAPLTI
jgi:hypothetical protein